MAEFNPIAYINEPRWQQVRPGLERIRNLLERMGNPQDRLNFVHVAGTNGKGSTCVYIASMLTAAGYRTGMFTSPYIIQFEERIRVDGENIPYDDLCDVTSFVRQHAEAMATETGEHPTEFELMTAVAFEHFARSECDIVVCEVGLGGRLDSTNIISAPEVCVITRLGLDHTGMLGDTIEAIAHEKAGIIKPGSTVVAWPQDDEAAMRVIREKAESCECELVVPDFDALLVSAIDENGVRAFRYDGRAFFTRLLASYQPYNAALAIEAVEALRCRGWEISYKPDMTGGIFQASWPGRFEVVSSQRPVIIVDGGHNPQGAHALADSLRDVFPGQKATFVMSVLADKDYTAMIEEVLPLASAFVCATPPNPRALAAANLAEAIREQAGDADLAIEVAGGFPEAIEKARHIASQGIICAFGSLYSVADIKQALQE